MKGFGAMLGLLVALALLSLGLLYLPGPELQSLPGLFAALWLAVAFLSALAFAREAWRREKVERLRRRRYGRTGIRRRERVLEQGGSGAALGEEVIRQRERRSD